jgi:hypothetical protein
MPRGLADVLDVGSSETFLTGGGPGEHKRNFPKKFLLELNHARAREEQGGIIGRHKRPTGFYRVAVSFEKVEKTIAKFVSCHARSIL